GYRPHLAVAAMMRRDPRTRVLGVVHRIRHQLLDVFVLQAVVNRRALTTCPHQTSHPQLRQVLRHRWRRFADALSELIHRQLAVRQQPQHLNPRRISQHPKYLNDQGDLLITKPCAVICMHTQIIDQGPDATFDRTTRCSTAYDFRSTLEVMDVVTFSDLQLKGKATVERWLCRSPGRSLLVRRRDAEDLVLTTASRAQQAREASSVTSRMFVAL